MSPTYLQEIFARDGILAKELAPAYEWRPQQAEMAFAVHRTLSQGGVLLVEAPTGVGKSLGYLVPGVLWAQQTRRPLVVSTYTRSLQDQILDQDLPHVQRLAPKRVRAIVLKGRGNYLCRARWDHLLDEMRGTVEGEDLERGLGAWVESTQTGDLSEAPRPSGLSVQRHASLLSRICGDARFCATPRCTPESGCFFKRSRAAARDAHLVVVNHALLLVDLFAGAAGLPDWGALIVDEAHQLPRAAAEPLSLAMTERGLESALRALGGRGEAGCTDEIRRALRRYPGRTERARQLAALRQLEVQTARLEERARRFWAELKAAPWFPGPDRRLRYGTTGERRELFPPSGLDLCAGLRAQADALEERLEEVRRRVEEIPDLGGGSADGERRALLEAARGIDAAREAARVLGELLTPTRPEQIYWVEAQTGAGAALRAAPLDVGPPLRQALFRAKDTVVLTSATIAVEASFAHFASRIGLEADAYEGLALSSPFALPEQVAARVLTGGPDPNDPLFAEATARGIELLARRLRRKMLVLFTAHETLRRVEGHLRAPLGERGIRLLAQGLDGGRRRIRADFRGEGPAVLLGAASFWEGVDFPGEELEILVMARLPFLVPNDPLVEAACERLQQEARDPFLEFHLPEAILRFRQGFGRLIRRRSDRGVFVVVDPRLETRGYGRRFARAVGLSFRALPTWEDLAADAEAWLGPAPGRGRRRPEAPPGS